MTHDHSSREMRGIHGAEQLLRARVYHALRGRKMRGIGVSRPVVNQRDFPAQARRKINNRRGIRPRTQ